MFIYKFILQGRFFPSFQFPCSVQRSPSRLISKQLGRKAFSMEQLIPICYYVNKRILFQLINKSLVFNLIAILKKILSFYSIIYIRISVWCVYVCVCFIYLHHFCQYYLCFTKRTQSYRSKQQIYESKFLISVNYLFNHLM